MPFLSRVFMGISEWGEQLNALVDQLAAASKK